jgi:HEAT repeat protein
MAIRTGQAASGETAPPRRGTSPVAWAALLVALYAAVMGTLAMKRSGGSSGGGAAVDGDELSRRMDRQASKVREELGDDLKRAVAKAEETLGRAERRLDEARASLKAVVDEGARRAEDSARASAARTEVLEERVKEVADASGALKGTVDGLVTTIKDVGSRPVAPTPATPSGTPAPTPKVDKPPVEADPVTPGPSEAEIAANKEKVRAAIADLASADIGKVFNACLVLAKLGDLEATEPLIKILKEHKDAYARVAAANAIGSLHACDGVVALVAAFLDKDEGVVLSAARAYSKITGQDTGLSGSPSRKDKVEAKDKWGKWWHDHEKEVRARWNQPAAAPGAPPAGPGTPPPPGPGTPAPK